MGPITQYVRGDDVSDHLLFVGRAAALGRSWHRRGTSRCVILVFAYALPAACIVRALTWYLCHSTAKRTGTGAPASNI